MTKIIKVKCQICGRELEILEGSAMYGIVCKECFDNKKWIPLSKMKGVKDA